MMSRLQVLRLFSSASFTSRLFVKIRWMLFDASVLEKYLPENGLFVDIGCGHGSWAFYMLMSRQQCTVLGVDPDEKKITIASRIVSNLGTNRIRFIQGYGQEVEFEAANVISIMDVMYLIPYHLQQEILLYCTDHLAPGGVLLLKTVDQTPRWKFYWNLLQEYFAVKLFKFTRGSEFYFRPSHQWQELIEAFGLEVEVRRLDKGYIHPHVLIIGRKI